MPRGSRKEAFTMKTMAVLLVVLFLSSCAPQTKPMVIPPGDEWLDEPSVLKKFTSAAEIAEYLQKSGQASSMHGGMMARGMAMDMAVTESVAAPKAASESAGAADYSTTNIQVQGVDEADFVKNDGRYIYMVSQDNLVIVDAYPPERAKIVFETELKGRPRDIFVNGDMLVVFIDDNSEIYSIEPYDFMPRPRYTQTTEVRVYDVSDRGRPELEHEFQLTGSYYQSRMIGDHVYFVVMDNVYLYQNYVDMPVIRSGNAIAVQPEVFYFDNPEDNYVFHTVSSLNIKTGKIESKSFLMGYTNTMYVSEESIYVAYQKNAPWRYWEMQREERFIEAVVPELPSDVRRQINEIYSGSKPSYEKWVLISQAMDAMYQEMDKSSRDRLMQKIAEAVEEWEIERESERQKTVIHKINIEDGRIDYDTSGEVPGHLLNQFSMDEFDGDLRVATTTNIWAGRRSTMFNNVYVMDDKLDIIGRLERLAEGESIYSARFVGDRLYMVTFERIDPLFVIDLSRPERPEVLGELKIPGYSDYLHPYDKDHIIGIGKETAENQWGGVSIKGVKLALFDVSDVKNPKQLDMYEIGASGTDSEALRDHKAVLFDKDKNSWGHI